MADLTGAPPPNGADWISAFAKARAEVERLGVDLQLMTEDRDRMRKLAQELGVVVTERDQLRIQVAAAVAETNRVNGAAQAYHNIRAAIYQHEREALRRAEMERETQPPGAAVASGSAGSPAGPDDGEEWLDPNDRYPDESPDGELQHEEVAEVVRATPETIALLADLTAGLPRSVAAPLSPALKAGEMRCTGCRCIIRKQSGRWATADHDWGCSVVSQVPVTCEWHECGKRAREIRWEGGTCPFHLCVDHVATGERLGYWKDPPP